MPALSIPPAAQPVLGDAALHSLLEEDAPYGDLTTESLGIGSASGCIRFFVRDPMRVCGTEEAARMFELCGARSRLVTASGQQGAAGTLLLEAEGKAGALHRGWKAAQTLVEWCSGISTSAAEITAAARRGHPQALVAGTRKNVPGNRRLAAKAFVSGGAVMHRLGLSETLLVFAEHRAFLGDERPAQTLERLRHHCPEKRVVVEVSSLEEALRWCEADVLQLEKFPPELVAQTRAALRERGAPALVAAAGGIHAANAEDYARAGAHLLVTTAPHLAPPRDVQVRFEAP
ncbi:ModD protein [Thiorhodovibrio frisius]|uniref:Putative pyrophosphorylase ModD n=1 Tax=Thiorhodovibrio frisius TaxID=631362 RepID=H8Z085_9GAMM|nr:ModD protein [Thiorhodovibrio frisius]EIC22293.1 putative molybdenum utilization protein ModD [Thiorhodovibrio frisius]WPL24587.1 Nicotinate-nucleotide pyrophosphorylase [carboxylating] [Thiorhodovibrio frisius]